MNPIKNKTTLLLAIALALGLSSCASKPAAPQPEPPVPAPTPVVQPETPQPAAPAVSAEELDKLLAEAATQKKRAFDWSLFEVFPDDYKAADAAFAAGKAAYDAKDGPAAKEGLSKAVSLFTDLNARGIVELSSMRRKNAEDMRAAAVKAGAEAAAAERFAHAETAFAEAAALAEAKDHEKAVAAFERARALYELAYKRSLGAELRDRIENKGYAAWDSGNYRLAENKYAEEDALYAAAVKDGAKPGAKELGPGIDALDEAVLRYNLVVQKGRQGIAGGKKDKSDEAKGRSDSIKSAVAVKEGYAAALAVYEEGLAKLAAGDYEGAAEAFEAAGAAFDEVYAIAAEKRQKAAEAMKAAAEAADASRRKAENADSGADATSAASSSEW